MLVSCIRTVILYVILIITVRIMGKKQVGELEPAELVVVFLLSELASIPMQDMNLPLMSSVIPIATLISLEILLSALILKSRFLRKVLQGTPSILINKGELVEREMRRQRYNIDELMEQIRREGYSDIREVEYAILENSGKISVIPSARGKALTAPDMNIEGKPGALPFIVIADGKVAKTGLKLSGITQDELMKILKKKGIDRPSEVFIATMDSMGEFHFQKKERKK
ncbi:MAG: DUF421 domain-containing protein [Monoglobales bacterium]